ncbi:MAG TPA: amine dehydrogenase large subunit [Steroidobacter sp.]|uniref:amine dehydrogenase large subunit n=1 Tax=Steroidobacter sp. TaxID=1978227 RepID=UPI002EDA34A6
MKDGRSGRNYARFLMPVLLFAQFLGVAAAAEVAVDPLAVTQLPERPSPHWVWVNDIVFHHMADGKAFLVDGDSGSMLGMLSTGFGFGGVIRPKNTPVIYAPETYFSRGTRGTRTDVVTIYDGRTLMPLSEIEIPPKRVSAIPELAFARLSDDERFLWIYNFTPAQSVTVVDTAARKTAGEIEIAGCALIYPTGPRGFFSLCSDATLLQVQTDDSGQAVTKTRTKPLFKVSEDPVTEKAVRDGSTWLFTTFSGTVLPIDGSGKVPQARPTWSLLDDAARKESWLPGGIQHLALHEPTRRLYSLMHVGGADTHKDPGTEVWVYDVAKRKRIQRIVLQDMATSIAVTQDAEPLLFTTFIGAAKVMVYDANSGEHRRTIEEIGFTPTTLVTY